MKQSLLINKMNYGEIGEETNIHNLYVGDIVQFKDFSKCSLANVICNIDCDYTIDILQSEFDINIFGENFFAKLNIESKYYPQNRLFLDLVQDQENEILYFEDNRKICSNLLSTLKCLYNTKEEDGCEDDFVVVVIKKYIPFAIPVPVINEILGIGIGDCTLYHLFNQQGAIIDDEGFEERFETHYVTC